jgi:hypothetical protein
MRGTRLRSIRPAVVLTVAFVLVAATPLAASASVSLIGEELGDTSQDWTSIFGANAPDLCREEGASRLPFTLAGVATGPYPGQFTETGVAVIGRLTQTFRWDVDVDAGPIIGYRSSFRITSGDTVIEGEKWLVAPRGKDRSIAGCGSFTDAPSRSNPGWRFTGFEIVFNAIPVRYRATLTSPGGSEVVTGTATAGLLAEHFVTTRCPFHPPICGSESSGWGGGELFS